jgi:hypothetical protein
MSISSNLFKEQGDIKVEKYVYGMRMRGFSIGCQPMKNWVERLDDVSCRYYDILVYSERLCERDVKNYELDYIGTMEEYLDRARSRY